MLYRRLCLLFFCDRLPLGVFVGLSFGNMGMIGLGFPIGMAVGIGVGSKMDKKAFTEGRQLDFEMK